MDPALGADGVDGDDVLMVQLCRRSRLILETLELAGIEGQGKGKDFQRDAPAQRELFRLVYDAHAAAADFAENAIIAQRGSRLPAPRRGPYSDGRMRYGTRLMQRLHTVEAIP